MSDLALTAENIESIARALAGDKYDEHGWSCRHRALDAILEARRLERDKRLAELGFDPVNRERRGAPRTTLRSRR